MIHYINGREIVPLPKKTTSLQEVLLLREKQNKYNLKWKKKFSSSMTVWDAPVSILH